MAKRNGQEPLYEHVVKNLKGQIISGTYIKGELLPSEKELIDSFGVSRITIRKALSILAEMGLIETCKGKGSIVLFSPENIDTHCGFAEAVEEYCQSFMSSIQIRLLLEPEIARQVALSATREQARELRKCVEGGQDSENLEEFHRMVVSILDNAELNQIMKSLFALEGAKNSFGVVLPEKREKFVKELEEQHFKILEAIEQKNGEFAYFYMKEHTTYIGRIYEEYFELLRK